MKLSEWGKEDLRELFEDTLSRVSMENDTSTDLINMFKKMVKEDIKYINTTLKVVCNEQKNNEL